MNCMFIGHHDAPSKIKNYLSEAILYLAKKGIKNFLVGNNGNFDDLTQCVLEELSNEGYNLNFNIVLSRVDEGALSRNQNATVFPEGLENIPPRFSISKRNNWLIKNSSFLIAYVKHGFSNSGKILEKARKKGLYILNLADIHSSDP